jgi:alpha-beta hydrolase superfamily lysophospholipase
VRSDTKAELQMLREYFWRTAPEILCRFCLKPLAELPHGITFGHRRHPPVDVDITMHHEDRDRENNQLVNIKPSHTRCHKTFHGQERTKKAFERKNDAGTVTN